MVNYKNITLIISCFIFMFSGTAAMSQPTVDNLIDGYYTISADDGRKLRITAYGDYILRAQSLRVGEDLFPNDHYEMVESHAWPSNLRVHKTAQTIRLSTSKDVSVTIDRKTLAAQFSQNGVPKLSELDGVNWQGNEILTNFVFDPSEHFSGLGHTFYGRENSIDLKGKTVHRNYGREQIQQAPLIVPFYMSSKGYGVFMNSTFANTFNFGTNKTYSFSIDDSGFGGRMDYFYIAGPQLKTVLDRYTQLTGRPRLPMKSVFGLQLSDKGHDHNSPTPSDEQWWRAKILAHRAAGFPLDHVVNDNRWRAAGGKRCESKLEWDKERYPDPQAYADWLHEQGLNITIDLNRCIAQFSDGWKKEFNVSTTGKIDFANSAPDLTNENFRTWFWNLFYQKSLDPALSYPISALWIDEFDEQGAIPKDTILANGRSSAEMRNYWFFLIAKALVQDGWDKSDIPYRPYVWVRGMTAGAQRYATLWSGDIHPSYSDMKTQVRAMQLAGLSGFPYWGHDAGGFHDWENGLGPNDNLYIQWSMALGSFSPLWKPHGMGESRWPLDRSEAVQVFVKKYSQLRYELMPYLYSAAHQAAATGLPMARAMILDYQEQDNAWIKDLQYMWGDNLLVAPNTNNTESVDVWLPKGNWVDFDSKKTVAGDRIISVPTPLGKIPIFVKQGAIITKRENTLSTAFINKEILLLDVYAGSDGSTILIEDDDQSEAYRKTNAKMTTLIDFNSTQQTLTVNGAQGSYSNAPTSRKLIITIYGNNAFSCALINGQEKTGKHIENGGIEFNLPTYPINKTLKLSACLH